MLEYFFVNDIPTSSMVYHNQQMHIEINLVIMWYNDTIIKLNNDQI